MSAWGQFRQFTASIRKTPAGVVFLYALFASAWIVLSGFLLSAVVRDSHLHERIEMSKGLMFVVVTSLLLYLLLQGWNGRAAMQQESQPGKAPARHLMRLPVLFFLVALVIPLVGFAIIKLYAPQVEKEAYGNLQAIASLKTGQIENWLDERVGDARGLSGDTGFAKGVGKFISRTDEWEEAGRHILRHLSTLRNSYGYDSIMLLDASGRVRLTLGQDVDIPPELLDLLRRSIDGKEVLHGDLYRDVQDRINMDWVVPIMDAKRQHAVAGVVLRIAPEKFLFPLIQTWPTASHSAESILLRREGDFVMYLNELRYHKGVPLSMRLPLSQTELPSVRAVLDAEPGSVPGRDYRGKEVLAVHRPVAGTDWHLEAKIDREEVMEPLHTLAFLVTLVASFAVIVVAVILRMLWRQQQHTLELEIKASSLAAIEESEKRYRAVAESANDAITTVGEDGRIVNWNPGAELMFGYSETEAVGMEAAMLVPERFRERYRGAFSRLVAGEQSYLFGKHTEMVGLCSNGSEFPLEISLSQWKTASGRFFTAIIRDIAERKQAEQKLVQSERHFRSLFENMLEGYAYCRMLFEQDMPVDFLYLEVNEAFSTLTGLKEVVGKRVSEVIPGLRESNPELFDTYGRVARSGRPEHCESYVASLGIWLSISVYCPMTGDFVAVFDDITRRKKDEESIKRLARLYAALSQCNQSIVHSTSEGEMLRLVCCDVVQQGGMKMAWIGLVDENTRTVKVADSCGDSAGYLQDIHISLDAVETGGRGPTGTAIRENRPVWCQDFQSDPATQPWHERGARSGWGASAALPLRREGKVVGAFTLYAAERNAFDEDARRLLQEVVEDINFALDKFANESKRRQAEAEVRTLAQRITLATDAAAIGIWDWYLQEDLWFATPTYFTMLGYQPREGSLDISARLEGMHPDDRAMVEEKIRTVLAGGERPCQYEARIRHANGSWHWVSVSGRVVERDEHGRPSRMLGVRMDITERKQMAVALEERETRLRTLVGTIPDLIWLKDMDGVYLGCNPTFERFFGAKESEIVGKTDYDFVNKELADFFREHDRMAAEAGKPTVNDEWVTFADDGHRALMETTKTPMRDPSGRLLGVLGIAHDITPRRRAEESLRKLSLAVEQSPNSIVITNLDAKIEYANAAFVKATGYSLEEAIGQNPNILQSGKTSKETYADMWAHLTRGEMWKGEFTNKRKDGSEYTESVQISPVRQEDGTVTHYLAIKEDITEFKKAQQAIYRLNEELEEKVRQRTAELEQARRAAEQASRAKSDFLAAMSHEIRTPMNGVIGMIDVLQQSSLNARQMEMANIIHDSAFALLSVIDDILDFSKIEAGKLQLEMTSMNIADVVEGAGEALDHMALKKRVELTMYVDPRLPERAMGDPHRLRQILVNLTSNAIKFSSGQDRPGKVSLRALLVQEQAGTTMAEFVVSDNGVGIDEATQARLFRPFTQADLSTTRTYGGTGLGLAISRQLASMMDGEVTLFSEPGKGAVFAVRIPFATVPPTGEARASVVAGLPCLVVGEGALAGYMADYLEHGGASVGQAADLAAARAWIAGQHSGAAVVVVDDAEGSLSPDELRAIAAGNRNIRFAVIGRGGRRLSRIENEGNVVLDGTAMRRKAFLEAVAVAAGRISGHSEEVLQDRPQLPIPPSHEEARRRGRLILIAEDNETNRKVIRQQLMLLGETADIAGNGREALELWRSGGYAMLLADLHMPEMDGYELTKTIRAMEGGKPHMPIIAFTANALKGEAEHCLAIGMDDYLTKPVQLNTLRAMLEKWLPGAAAPVEAPPAAQAQQGVPLDLDVLRKLVGDDRAIIAEFLHDFRHSAAQTADEIRAACAAGETAAAGALAHRLKSSARSVGALRLGELCAEMEKAGKAADQQAMLVLLPRFEEEYAAMTAYLDSMQFR